MYTEQALFSSIQQALFNIYVIAKTISLIAQSLTRSYCLVWGGGGGKDLSVIFPDEYHSKTMAVA